MRVEAARARRRRRSFGCGVAALTSITVLVMGGMLAVAVFYFNPGNGSVSASQIAAQPGSLAWDARTPFRLLLLGTTSNGSQPDRSDTLMVLSVSPSPRTVTLLSIPPNLWVSITGYGQGTIASAYGDGGIRLAQHTLQSVLHVPLPYYLVAGSAALRQLVDAVGGVQLRIPPSLTSGGRTATRPTDPQQLDGNAVLGYVAHSGSAPPGLDAVGRQQQLFRALLTQGLTGYTLARLPAILNDLGGSIITNFPYDRISLLAHLLSQLPPYPITMRTLDPASGTVSPYAGGGTNVLLPNWDRLGGLVRGLFSEPDLSNGAAVDVINGTDVLGRAAVLADWLHQAGTRIREVASAQRGQHPLTEVWIAPGASPHVLRTARALGTLLQAPLVTKQVMPGGVPVTVLIGQNYQEVSQQ